MTYKDYSQEIFHEFIDLQNRFRADFGIDDFDSWYYEQAIELLTLSKGNDHSYFKYVPVGTFSNKTNTWLWSWANQHSIEKTKKITLQVKEFGIQNNFDLLIDKHFECERNDGWTFTAISQKILGGIGGYRVEADHLTIYFLVIGRIDNEIAKELKDTIISCERHGTNRLAYVCQHLNLKTKTGFEEAFETYHGMELEDDDDFQAWCNDCEKMRLSTDGWNDESMEYADIRLVCEDCYFEMKTFNSDT